MRFVLTACWCTVFLGIIGFPLSAERQLAPEARGLLPEPADELVARTFTAAPNAFVPDPSGGSSRIVFQSDENPDFKLVIRDFSFPPDEQSRSFSLPSGGLIHIVSGQGHVAIGNDHSRLQVGVRAEARAGATVSVVNTGQRPLIVRALALEAK